MQHNSLFSILLYLTQELQCNSDAICVRARLCVQIAWKLSAEEMWGSTVQLGQIGHLPSRRIWVFKKELPVLFWSQRCRERKQLRHKYVFLSAYFAFGQIYPAEREAANSSGQKHSETLQRDFPELTISALQYRVPTELLLIQSALS